MGGDEEEKVEDTAARGCCGCARSESELKVKGVAQADD